MISPTEDERAPARSSRAVALRRKPSCCAASSTLLAVAADTYGSPLRTRDAVLRLTPESAATWRSVGRPGDGAADMGHTVSRVPGRSVRTRFAPQPAAPPLRSAADR